MLKGANTIVVQPTGNGKSLCYQFPPFVTGGTAVIISPTLSLIHDQTEDLCAKGIAATYLCSTQQDSQMPAAIAAGEFKVVSYPGSSVQIFINHHCILGSLHAFSEEAGEACLHKYHLASGI